MNTGLSRWSDSLLVKCCHSQQNETCYKRCVHGKMVELMVYYVKQLGGQINLDQEVATMNEAAGRVKVISKIISAKMALMSLAVVGGR